MTTNYILVNPSLSLLDREWKKMSWSELPLDMLPMIAGKLTEATDLLRFRSVCSSWRFASKSISMPLQFPWLILPTDNSNNNCYFYSFSEDHIYSISLPASRDIVIFGSSKNRLLTLNYEESWISGNLIDPLNGDSMRLPSLSSSPLLYSSTPIYSGPRNMAWDHSTSVIMVACTNKAGLFYSYPSHNWFWRPIEFMRNVFVIRIIYHSGHFFVLERNNYRTTIIEARTLRIVGIIPCPEYVSPIEIHLTVSPSQKLLLLVHTTWTYVFPNDKELYKVFQLECCNDNIPNWIEVTELDELSFFVDDVHCFSFEAGGCSRLRENCIYHARSKSVNGLGLVALNVHYISVFNMRDHSFEELDCRLNSFVIPPPSRQCSPSWFLPNLS